MGEYEGVQSDDIYTGPECADTPVEANLESVDGPTPGINTNFEPSLPPEMEVERKRLFEQAQLTVMTRELSQRDKRWIKGILKDYPNLQRLVLHGIDKTRGPIAELFDTIIKDEKGFWPRIEGYDLMAEDVVASLEYLKDEVGISVEGLIEELITLLPTLPNLMIDEFAKISPRSMRMLEIAEQNGEVTEEEKVEIAKVYEEDLREWVARTTGTIAVREGLPWKEIETHIAQYRASKRDALALYFLPRKNVLEEFQLLFNIPYEQFLSLAHGRPVESIQSSSNVPADLENLLLDSDFEHVAVAGHGAWDAVMSYGIYGDPYQNVSRFTVELLSQRSTLIHEVETLAGELNGLWTLIDPLVDLDDPAKMAELLEKNKPHARGDDDSAGGSWITRVGDLARDRIGTKVEERGSGIREAAEKVLGIFDRAQATLPVTGIFQREYSEDALRAAKERRGEEFEPIQGVYRYTCGTDRYSFANPDSIGDEGDFPAVKSGALNQVFGRPGAFSAVHSDYVGRYESDLIDWVVAGRLATERAEAKDWLSTAGYGYLPAVDLNLWGGRCTVDGSHLGLDQLQVIESEPFGQSVVDPESQYGTLGQEGLNYLPQFIGDPLFEQRRGGVELFGLD